MPKDPEDEDFGPEEAARRRDEVVKRMLATPPQPKPAPESKRGRPKKTNP